MVLGGVPHYWSFLKKDSSLAQNLDRMFFSEDGELKDEFDELYASLFKRKAPYEAIVTALAGKRSGMTREEINGTEPGMYRNEINCEVTLDALFK